jgi:hypothetical protein
LPPSEVKICPEEMEPGRHGVAREAAGWGEPVPAVDRAGIVFALIAARRFRTRGLPLAIT